MRKTLRNSALLSLILLSQGGAHFAFATSDSIHSPTDSHCQEKLTEKVVLTPQQEKIINLQLMRLGAFLNNNIFGSIQGITRINAHEGVLHVYATIAYKNRPPIYAVAVFDPVKNKVIEMVGPSQDGKKVEIYVQRSQSRD